MRNTRFDQEINRIGTNSAKWDLPYRKYGRAIKSLSVADMDLPAPIEVISHLSKLNQMGIYGYTVELDNYYEIVSNYIQRHYHYSVALEHITFCPRVIQAVSIFIQYISKQSDSFGIFSPSYSPIMNAVKLNDRNLILCPLLYKNNRYQIDFDVLEECFRKIKYFILISPHNPTGKVFSQNELLRICALAEKYNVFVISDDVHADFDFSGNDHVVISSLSDYIKQNSMVCISPAKSFNFAGLEISNIVIENDDIRNKFRDVLNKLGFHNPNFFSMPALEIAYQHCDGWLSELKGYIKENRELTKNFFERNIPKCKVVNSQGTYLLWIDYKEIGISESHLKQLFIKTIHLDVSWGSDFGSEYHHFFRINVATPRSFLMRCLDEIKFIFNQATKEGNENGY